MAFDRLSNRSDEFCMNLSLKSRDLEKQFNGYYDDWPLDKRLNSLGLAHDFESENYKEVRKWIWKVI